MTEDNFASSILAGLLLIIMFGSMRAFYGCWPWEYRKTWYRTQKEIAHLNALMGPSRPSDWRNRLTPKKHQRCQTRLLTRFERRSPSL